MARILVIDDDQLFVKLIVAALAKRGHDVEFAFDGIPGMKLALASHFDAVICDMVMPNQEGLQTIRDLRHRFPHLAIVAISGGLSLLSKLEVLEIASKLGADLTIKKPFKMSELTDAVDRAMALRSVPAASC